MRSSLKLYDTYAPVKHFSAVKIWCLLQNTGDVKSHGLVIKGELFKRKKISQSEFEQSAQI